MKTITVRGNEMHTLAEFFGVKVEEVVKPHSVVNYVAEREYNDAMSKVKELKLSLELAIGELKRKEEGVEIAKLIASGARVERDMQGYFINLSFTSEGKVIKPIVFPSSVKLVYPECVAMWTLPNPQRLDLRGFVSYVMGVSSVAKLRTLAEFREIVEVSYTGSEPIVWPEYLQGEGLLSEVVNSFCYG